MIQEGSNRIGVSHTSATQTSDRQKVSWEEDCQTDYDHTKS
uniref:Uncharacterized protein n=1 Tax=Arundo donax TaxID=35708 RepID=A0A0A9BQG7_ARUDO